MTELFLVTISHVWCQLVAAQDSGVGKTLIGGAQSETTHRVVSNLYNNL